MSAEILILVVLLFTVANLLLGIFVLSRLQAVRQESIGEQLNNFQQAIGAKLTQEFRQSREEDQNRSARLQAQLESGQKNLQDLMRGSQKDATDSLVKTVGILGSQLELNLKKVDERLVKLTESNEASLAQLSDRIDQRLNKLQDSNEQKLDQMRAVVDEKLQSTLEKRLGESFKLVSERLEAVQRGLGEMQNLATGVDNLKKVLSNVKARGTWGEVQLEALLSEVLTPDQFDRNVKTISGSNDFVEFAIKLPGPGADAQRPVWLPIDAKFPQEDYTRLLEASELGDDEGVRTHHKKLIGSIRQFAKDIATKYVAPPATTDFAILFLPTEGLYAEVLREPGLVEELQQKYRVVLAGPTSLAAILNSLRMGFRTLAIEKRSSEVWQTLAQVKLEFGKFGDVLLKVKKQLDTASRSIDETGRRSRAIEKSLRAVEELPESNTELLPGLNASLELESEGD
ncbi:MAG: DNA recombination protein RmuC [Leptospiraceae bacterium]|nr:DNA recombination protein RmuC [Leptospiraceae bacterium]